MLFAGLNMAAGGTAGLAKDCRRRRELSAVKTTFAASASKTIFFWLSSPDSGTEYPPGTYKQCTTTVYYYSVLLRRL